jgi:hypothetical protein
MTKHIDETIQHKSFEHCMNRGYCSHQFKTQYKETERNSTNMLRYFKPIQQTGPISSQHKKERFLRPLSISLS